MEKQMIINLRVESAIEQHWKAARRLGIVHLGGRPPKYSDEMAALAYHILSDVRSVASLNYVASVLNISRSTLFEWKQRHSDFALAIEWGKAVQECQLATRLVNGWGNPQGILYCLINLHGWRNNPVREEQYKVDIREALERHEASAVRVQWDVHSVKSVEQRTALS